jgi:uncharacterized membrane protein YedE/YeeE
LNEFWFFLWGGLAIGGIATLYPVLTGRYLGVSSIYAALFERRRGQELEISDELEAALLAATRAEFGADAAPEAAPTWTERVARWHGRTETFRPLFLIGLVLGATVAALAGDDFGLQPSLGARFDDRYGELGPLPLLVLLVAGLCIGVGTRVGAGCTSGHGISGLARGEKGSLLTTFVFWSTAVAVAWALALAGVG